MALINQTEISDFWKYNSINPDGSLKAMFIATKNKRPAVNSYQHLNSFNELNFLPEFGFKISTGICFIDLDDQQQIIQFEKILKVLQIKPLIIKTNRGKHYYFKTNHMLPHRNKALLACGIIADQKNGNHKNCLAIIKENDRLRIVEQPVNLIDLPLLPEYFLPTLLTNKKASEWNKNLISITKGVRNDTLFKYSSIILKNTQDCFIRNKRTFLVKTIKLINWIFLEQKLTDQEIFSIVNSAWSNYQKDIKQLDVDCFHPNHLINQSQLLAQNWTMIKSYLETYVWNLKKEYTQNLANKDLFFGLFLSIEQLLEKLNWVNHYFEQKPWL